MPYHVFKSSGGCCVYNNRETKLDNCQKAMAVTLGKWKMDQSSK